MVVTLVSRCRLCGALFEETLIVYNDRVEPGRGASHPLEDGNVWCSACLERIDRIFAKLWESVPAKAPDDV